MTDIVKSSGQSMAERLQAALAKRETDLIKRQPPHGVLLLDVSGSMEEPIDGVNWDLPKKIDVLAKVVDNLNPERTFVFSDDCQEYTGRDFKYGMIHANTYYGRAFRKIKEEGIRNVVMVTDGAPTDVENAMRDIEGLTVEFVYVGPQPRPVVLDTLAKMCQTQVVDGELVIKEVKRLALVIRGLLGSGQ